MGNPMKKYTILIITILCIIITITPETYSQRKLAQTGFKFLSVSTDARVAGMADAVTSVYGTSTSMLYNPAGMAEMERTADLNFGNADWIADINYTQFTAAFNPFDDYYGIFGISIISLLITACPGNNDSGSNENNIPVTGINLVQEDVYVPDGGRKQLDVEIMPSNATDQDVVWSSPIAVGNQPVRLHIGLFPVNNGEIAFEIYSQPHEEGAGRLVYSRGTALFSPASGGVEVPQLDLSALQARCSRGSLSSHQCYDAFRSMGIDYGPVYQGIEKVLVGQGQVLAKLSLPASVSDTRDQLVLHPRR